MKNLKTFLALQKFSVVISFVAIFLAIISLISVNKMQTEINNLDLESNKMFKPIKDVPDVEIIKADGTITKISATESKDELSKFVNQKKEEKNNKDLAEKKINKVEPVPRGTIENSVENKQKPQVENKNEKKSGIFGNFVVQVGAFKNEEIAKKNCDRIKQHLKDKQCGVATTNRQTFRSIIYPFDTNDEATKFQNYLSVKAHVSGFVKKNG